VDHPKTRALAKIWGCHPYTVVGFLVKLWGYCLEFQEDGIVDGRPLDVLDELAAPCLATSIGTMPTVREALLRAGFIDVDGKLHDWEDYAGALVERRRKDRRRKRLTRGRLPPDVRGTSTGQVADTPRTSAPRVEKSRVEKSRQEAAAAVDYPTRCVIAVNQVLSDRLAGAYRSLTPAEHGDVATGWDAAGIPVEFAVRVLTERAWEFRATPLNRQPHTLRYFDAAMREAWAKEQADAQPGGPADKAYLAMGAAAAEQREREREQQAGR